MEEKKELKIKFTTAVILLILLAIIIVAIFVIMLHKNKQIKPTIIENQTGQTKTDFSIEFLKLENEEKNMVYSPLSIKYAINMLNEGANGNTKTQIENVIKNVSLTKYNNVDKVLSLANSVYIRDTFAEYVKEDYRKTLIEKYNAEINYDAFNNATNVNSWIEDKTLGIIKNMLNDDVVQNPSTNMILVNALAIDMEWANPFDGSDTSGEEFYLKDDNTMIATMMHKETNDEDEDVAYYKDNDITALTMDLKQYDDTQLQFVAIMPKDNVSEYIKTFNMEEFNTILEKMTTASETKNGVDISIPKFSFDYNLKLKNDLIDLGITDAFDVNLADFSNMANTELYVGDALHKADIDFSEEGIRAAATTVFAMKMNAVLPDSNQPEEIKINKPFLYFIRDKETNEIWFVGTVYEPNSWDEDKEEYR